MQNAALLIARLLFASLFLPSGYSTLDGIAGSASYFAGLGFPMATAVAWLVGLFELGAGLLVLVGFQTRAVSVLLALFCISTAFIGHYGQGGDDAMLAFMHKQAFMKDLAIAGGFLALAAAGAGAWSADGQRR